jgi:hypothetical protein
MQTESKCPFHKFLAKLKTFAGLPVPFVTKWIGGKPDFRLTDPDNWVKCIKEKLCGVCGGKLGDWCYYIGGDKTFVNGYFADPGMHEPCARESMRLCPFLNGTRRGYRQTGLPEGLVSSGLQDTSKRPDVMLLMKAWAAAARLVQLDEDTVVIAAGKLTKVEEF